MKTGTNLKFGTVFGFLFTGTVLGSFGWRKASWQGAQKLLIHPRLKTKTTLYLQQLSKRD